VAQEITEDLMANTTIESPVRQSTNGRTRPTAPEPPFEVPGPWTGRQYPASALEESIFVDQLELLSGYNDVDEFERRDVTVLLTALRCGLTPEQLLEQAPGVKPARLLAAHRELETRRMLSEHAWQTITVDGTVLAFETFAPCAAELLPAVISHLQTYRSDRGRFTEALEDATDQVVRATRRVRVLEKRVAEAQSDLARARQLGTLLYDIYGQGAWSLPTYMPSRVGALVPLRAAALLGDDITASRRVS
jgi:hypothetical protein